MNEDLMKINEELEQRGRRFCLRIEGIPLKNNETSEKVLVYVINLFELAEVNVSDMVIELVQTIGRAYKDRVSNKNCK